MKKQKIEIKYNDPLADCLSMFDDQFTITELSESLEKADSQSNLIIKSAKSAIKKAINNHKNDEDYKLVVQLEDGLKESIDKGDIKLVTGLNGEIFAQIRDSNGQFGKNLPIKKEMQQEGVSVESLEIALQMELIKDQLKSIVDIMKTIENRVIEVIKGQHNDRIGLFYSGLSLYAESKCMYDDAFRKLIIAQALKSLSDANAQMIQEMRDSIDFLITEQYKKTKKMTDKIDEHLSIIYQCFDVIYRASFLKAAIYQQNGEIISMLTTIEEYGRFVERMIVPYFGKLNELDKTNTFMETGTWGTIVHTLDGCKVLKQQIIEKQIYYLVQEDGNDKN